MRNNRLSLLVLALTFLIFLPVGYFFGKPVETKVPQSLERPRPIEELKALRAPKLDRQTRLINRFLETVRLQIDVPLDLSYLPLDLEEGIAGLYGSSLTSDRSFVILATTKKVSPADVVSYLAEAHEALPFLAGHRFKLEDSFEVEAPVESGLRPLKIIPSTPHRKLRLYAALGERKDGKGFYLFIMEAPERYFQDNEDGLDALLKSIRLRP